MDLYSRLYDHGRWGRTRRAWETSGAGRERRLGMGMAQVGQRTAQNIQEWNARKGHKTLRDWGHGRRRRTTGLWTVIAKKEKDEEGDGYDLEIFNKLTATCTA